MRNSLPPSLALTTRGWASGSPSISGAALTSAASASDTGHCPLHTLAPPPTTGQCLPSRSFRRPRPHGGLCSWAMSWVTPSPTHTARAPRVRPSPGAGVGSGIRSRGVTGLELRVPKCGSPRGGGRGSSQEGKERQVEQRVPGEAGGMRTEDRAVGRRSSFHFCLTPGTIPTIAITGKLPRHPPPRHVVPQSTVCSDGPTAHQCTRPSRVGA